MAVFAATATSLGTAIAPAVSAAVGFPITTTVGFPIVAVASAITTAAVGAAIAVVGSPIADTIITAALTTVLDVVHIGVTLFDHPVEAFQFLSDYRRGRASERNECRRAIRSWAAARWRVRLMFMPRTGRSSYLL